MGVLDYILHRPPMVLIDDILDWNQEGVAATLTIRPDLMFCEEEGLPTWVAIEIMAQTISLHAGLVGHHLGHLPKLGFLLGTRKINLPFSHFKIGQVLTVYAKCQYIHDKLGVFDCQIVIDGAVSMNATLSVYEPSEGEFV